MIPRRVELTNFLSFGDRERFEFSDDEPLWVLCGANGIGKSAVFDAMTFALFGHHRGGGQNADQLIRHGANSFLVVFGFEYNRVVYRIERGRDRRTPVMRVRRFLGVTWNEQTSWEDTTAWEDIDLSSYTGRDRIRGWTEATLGVSYEAFTASVMLRQGEADRIITAAPRERLDLLRQIIGAERYERLHTRVNTARQHLEARLNSITADRDRIPVVSPTQLEESATALKQAVDDLTAARVARDAAVVRVEQARQWNDLDRDRVEIELRLREADMRIAESEQIRRDHAQFEELGRVLPLARELVPLRDGLKRLDAEIARLTGELADATTARDEAAREAGTAQQRLMERRQQADDNRRAAVRLREEITRTQRLVALADEVARLDEQFADFPADLDAQHAAVEGEFGRFTEQLRTAGERRAAAVGLLQAAESRRRDFDAVEIGTDCSRCGQPVSEEHAQRERTELDGDIVQHRAERDAAQIAQNDATTALQSATIERNRLAGVIRERDRVRDRRELQRGNLLTQGVTVDAATLRAEIAERVQQAETHDQAVEAVTDEQQTAELAAARHEQERLRLDCRVINMTGELAAANNTQMRDAGRRDALLGQLPPAWQDRFPTLTPDDVNRDQTDFDRLRSMDIAGRFRQLAEDSVRRNEWERRQGQLARDIEQVPLIARCAVTDAEQAAHDAAQQLTTVETAHAAARDRDEQLRRDAELRRDLTEQHRDLDRNHTLHDELARLLGPNGLQRDIVRTAEREIVRYANDTVRNLSSGDLTIELDTSEEGPDRAFTLKVRRADDPTPIGVQFLSGSQKFRVAVAVALAIGRFASGQARPLESVIIDEGFGSLDRDGLQAMGDELRNLQQSQSLRRLILVSHQEEFVARFPVGYRLEPGTNGTTAVPFRREGGATV